MPNYKQYSFTNSGINRSLNNVRLAGLWMNGAGVATEEALLKAAPKNPVGRPKKNK